MRILVVEDEPGIASFIHQGLTEEQFAVDLVHDGQSGLAYARAVDYDALVIDIMLPRMDGISLLRQLRAEDRHTPVLILTARQAVDDRVAGLNAGADDYLVKPFAFAELVARLRALLRRPSQQSGLVLRVADLSLDTVKHEVRRGERRIGLHPREYAVLEYLMRNPGQALSRDQIIDHVWNLDVNLESNVVDVYIGYLRRKIGGLADPPLIHTVRGVGYRIAPEGEDA
ncbi:MAG: response regulator transcription factor [Caldilineae bacterium]|nr:response regulator transcription factor [Chloroflexota bacterium]MCB9176024.1 response regulator transcription factor [Caldilineae bacterium]